jgi:hypothetical protein
VTVLVNDLEHILIYRPALRGKDVGMSGMVKRRIIRRGGSVFMYAADISRAEESSLIFALKSRIRWNHAA